MLALLASSATRLYAPRCRYYNVRRSVLGVRSTEVPSSEFSGSARPTLLHSIMFFSTSSNNCLHPIISRKVAPAIKCHDGMQSCLGQVNTQREKLKRVCLISSFDDSVCRATPASRQKCKFFLTTSELIIFKSFSLWQRC